jgi:hypothetical protein
MPRTIYCWRCRKDMPMLTDEEWELVSPHLKSAGEKIVRYKREHNCSLSEATAGGLQSALQEYERITGYKETNPNALFHHILSMYGPPCHVCGKPLRTPQARYCAMCSAERPAF